MNNSSNNSNLKPTNGKNKDKTAYILLGGSVESMKKRVEAIKEDIKSNLNNNLKNKVIITGCKKEIKKIKELLKENGFTRDDIIEVLSYDTLTNISKIKKKTDAFNKYNKFIIPTSESHGHRVEMIFERLFTKSDSQKNEFKSKVPENPNKFTLELIKSGEPEAKYAKLAESIYRNVNPKVLQYTSIALRPKLFFKEYLIPSIKKEKGKKSMKRYLWDCIFGDNGNKANRYATEKYEKKPLDCAFGDNENKAYMCAA